MFIMCGPSCLLKPIHVFVMLLLLQMFCVSCVDDLTSCLLVLCPVMMPIRRDKRVSMGLNGDLYFSNVVPEDAKRDYCCNARFPFTHTIQQKNPFKLKVQTSE